MKEIEILKIIKEDILRILSEREKTTFNILEEEIKASRSFILKAIQKLVDENLIQKENSFLKLTTIGKEKGENILRKHLVIENYFKKSTTEKEAHEKANLLEHYISEEVINNIKELSTFKEKEVVPLINIELHKDRLITNISISDDELFERIISMGIVPGEKIKMINKISDGVIVKIENKKFAIDKQIVKNIKVLEHGKA
ncbi:MAG: FeoA domain-containing protein [Deltaproteobacteria bacterium]|nr:FeoA domain-containing protein [Deltaproteobacteria bacterium]